MVQSPSSTFDPVAFLAAWDPTTSMPQNNDFRKCIIESFGLDANDDYVYHATASVRLEQVQKVIDRGGEGGLHGWYRLDEGKGLPIAVPPLSDVVAYTDIFQPSTSTVKALSSFASNAKKGSLRAAIADHLKSKLELPSAESNIVLPKGKKIDFKNPYLDVWKWSCENLEWAGPVQETEHVKQSHHVLPVLYHHFGCVVPSYDALRVIEQLSTSKTAGDLGSRKSRMIVEVGSGNGYWTFLLRQMGMSVLAVDNGYSVWRIMWIKDTMITDGIDFIRNPPNQYQEAVGQSGKNCILLLVYPQVSGEFTSKLLKTYDGDIIVVAGTQNGNGFTGFKDQLVDQWMRRERQEFVKLMQIPLPSFAAKDEALFVFIRTNSV